MTFLFAHHGMLERLDFLHLSPQAPLEHGVAFLIYAALIGAVVGVPLALWNVLRPRRIARQATGDALDGMNPVVGGQS